MKIIKNNYITPAPIAYPYNYICQVCGSELSIEAANDIKTMTVPKLGSKIGETFPCKGFMCPACGGQNVTG